ncbi:MAG: hypothetical protein ABIR18_06165, partial [Chitinophagaceae bacterium]
FKSKEAGPKIIDTIWMTRAAKWNGIIQSWKKDPSIIILCWFDGTLQELQSIFSKETTADVSLLIASHVHTSQLAGKKVIAAEHYPLRKKEQELYQKLDLPEVIIHSALDEPLFDRFGGSKIVQMMKQLGMKEQDSVQHKMITQSIVNAQEKIEKKLGTEHLANSQEEWMAKNLVD